jgi:hypothetical protein
MFPQLDRTSENEPLYYAAFLCARVELQLRAGRSAVEDSLQRRLDAAMDAFYDGSLLQELEGDDES